MIAVIIRNFHFSLFFLSFYFSFLSSLFFFTSLVKRSQLRVNRRTTSNDKCQDIVASQLIFVDYFQESNDFCICILVPILCFSQSGVLHVFLCSFFVLFCNYKTTSST